MDGDECVRSLHRLNNVHVDMLGSTSSTSGMFIDLSLVAMLNTAEPQSILLTGGAGPPFRIDSRGFAVLGAGETTLPAA